MECRDMAPHEAQTVLTLVMRGFDTFVRPEFSDEGVAEFISTARRFLLERPEEHSVTVAAPDGTIVGDRCEGLLSHRAVLRRSRADGMRRRTGASGHGGLPLPCDRTASVRHHSRLLPVGVPVHTRLGFEVTGQRAEHHGIGYVPVCKRLPSHAS